MLVDIYNRLGFRGRLMSGIGWCESHISRQRSVVILPGVTGGMIDMMPLAMRYIESGYAVYVVDLPGHGGSSMVSVSTYDDMVCWLDKVVEQLGVTPTVIVANSFSSSVVYHALRVDAISASTRVVMAAPTPCMSHVANILHHAAHRLPERYAWDLYTSRIAQKLRIKIVLKSNEYAAERWLCDSERQKKRTTTLRNSRRFASLLYSQNPYVSGISAPSQERVSVVIGSEDNVVASDVVEVMIRLLPRARFVIVQGAGHILHFEAFRSYPV